MSNNSIPVVWLAAGLRSPFAKIDSIFSHLDAIQLSIPVVQAMLQQDGGTIQVRGITLDTILRRLPRVDLIDLDVQGAELDVLSASIDRLAAQVKRVHIGTHSADIENGLRNLFRAHGWQPVNDYPCQSRNTTPYGEIEFQDGVQTWVNPRV